MYNKIYDNYHIFQSTKEYMGNNNDNLSDKELENWIKESFFQQKGFIH